MTDVAICPSGKVCYKGYLELDRDIWLLTLMIDIELSRMSQEKVKSLEVFSLKDRLEQIIAQKEIPTHEREKDHGDWSDMTAFAKDCLEQMKAQIDRPTHKREKDDGGCSNVSASPKDLLQQVKEQTVTSIPKHKRERDKGIWSNLLAILKYTQSSFLILMFLCALIMDCKATAIHHRGPTASYRWTVSRLISPECSLDVQMHTDSCPKLANELERAVVFCGFSCPPHEKPVCQETYSGPVYFCSQENVTCDKGLRRQVEVNSADPTILYISEDVCPDGRYQPTPSDCYNACRYLHRIISSEHFLAKSPGTNVSPAVWYCNYREGYYNDKGELFVKADTFDLEGFCTHVRKKDPCPQMDTYFPLPNGTCVQNCSESEYRDDFDDFKCKPRQMNVDDKQHGSSNQSAANQEDDANQSSDHSSTRTMSTMISTATSTTTAISDVDKDKVNVTIQKTNVVARDSDSDTVLIVIGLIVGLTVAFAVSSAGIYYFLVRRKSKQVNLDPTDNAPISVRKELPADKGVMQTEYEEDDTYNVIQEETPEPPGSAGNDERPTLVPGNQFPAGNVGRRVVTPHQLTPADPNNTAGELQAHLAIDGSLVGTPRHKGHDTKKQKTHQEPARRPVTALDDHGNGTRKRRKHVTTIVTELRYSLSDSSSDFNDSSVDDDKEGTERKRLLSGQDSNVEAESEETPAAASEYTANEERTSLIRFGRTEIFHGNDEERQPYMDGLKDGFNEE